MSFEMLRNSESDIIEGREIVYVSSIDLRTIAWACDICCPYCDETVEIDFYEDLTGECPHCGKAFDIIVD